MEFTIKQSVLMKVLSVVQRGTSGKTSIAILEGIKIDVYKDRLVFTGSESNLSITAELSAKDISNGISVVETGSMVVKGRFFIEIIRKLPGDTVTIRSSQDHFQVQIQAEQADFTINAYDPQSYPLLPEIDSHFTLKIKGDILKNMIEQTIVSVFKKESRPILTGVQFSFNGRELKTVATDSHRLSQRIISLDQASIEAGDGTNAFSVVVPAKSLQELIRVIEDDSFIQLTVGENQILFHLDHYTIYSRLLEGIYPDTSRLIPTSYQSQLTINAKVLEDGADRVALLANNEDQESVCLNMSQDEIFFNSWQQEVGKMKEVLACKNFSGEDLVIHFNPLFLLDAVRTFKGVDITLYFNGPDRTFYMEEANASESIPHSFVQLITPIRTHSTRY